MRTGRPLPPLSVSEDQRSTLESWARRPKTAQALALRAKIILACAEGKPNGVVARQTRVRQQTVGKWRSRFPQQGIGRIAGRTATGHASQAGRRGGRAGADDDTGVAS